MRRQIAGNNGAKTKALSACAQYWQFTDIATNKGAIFRVKPQL
jgi:hypothetical protein